MKRHAKKREEGIALLTTLLALMVLAVVGTSFIKRLPSTLAAIVLVMCATGLAAGTYKLRQLLPTGWDQTTPASGYGISVTVASNQMATGKLFGEVKGF